jgi:mevalonate kinase
MARAVGTPNRRSQMLLLKLEREHNFSIVKEVVRLYEQTSSVYQPLFEKIALAMSQQQAMEEALTPAELEVYKSSKKEMWDILGKLMSYCYPKLKSLTVDTDNSDKIMFNISIPGVAGKDYFVEQLKPAEKVEPDKEDE